MKFLFLPALVQVHVVEQLDIHDILKVSTCSSTAEETIKKCRIKIYKAMWDDGMTWTNEVIYLRRTKKFESHYLHLFFRHSDETHGVPITVNGVTFFIRESPNHWYFDKKTDNMQNITRYLLSVFEFKIDLAIKWGLKTPSIPWDFTKSLLDTRRISDLTIFSDYKVTSASLPTEILIYLLEESTVDTFYCEIDKPDFEYSNALKIKKLHLPDASWLQMPALLNSKSSHMLIQGFEAKPQDLHLIIKKWLMKECLENLVTLEIEESIHKALNPVRTLNCDSKIILDGIQFTTWDQTVDQRTFRTFKFFRSPEPNSALSGVYEIVRDDGKRASILLSDDFFGFYVMDKEYMERHGNLS